MINVSLTFNMVYCGELTCTNNEYGIEFNVLHTYRVTYRVKHNTIMQWMFPLPGIYVDTRALQICGSHV